MDNWADTSHGLYVNGKMSCLRYTSNDMDDWYCSGKNGGYYYWRKTKIGGENVGVRIDGKCMCDKKSFWKCREKIQQLTRFSDKSF